jgi:hypothetical protein
MDAGNLSVRPGSFLYGGRADAALTLSFLPALVCSLDFYPRWRYLNNSDGFLSAHGRGAI